MVVVVGGVQVTNASHSWYDSLQEIPFPVWLLFLPLILSFQGMDQLQQMRHEYGGFQVLLEFYNILTINSSYVPGVLLGIFQGLPHFNYTIIQFVESYYYPHFRDEKTETWRGARNLDKISQPVWAMVTIELCLLRTCYLLSLLSIWTYLSLQQPVKFMVFSPF